MKKNALLFFTVLTLQVLQAQTTDDYRTIASGNWTVIGNWERYDGNDWVAATNIPYSSNGSITIREGHSISIFSNFTSTLDQITVESGANLNIQAPTILVDGPGDELTVRGTLTAYGPIVGTGTVEVSGSSATFNWDSPLGRIGGNLVFNIREEATLNLTGEYLRLGFDNFPPYATESTTSILNNYGSAHFSATGDLRIHPSSTFNNYGTITFGSNTTFWDQGEFNNYGTINGNNIVTFFKIFNYGSIAPGTSAGILTLNGQQPLSANSTLQIEMQDGSGAGTGHDQLARNSSLTLAGTLTVTETGTVPFGTYTIIQLSSGTVSGSFATVSLPAGYSMVVNSNNVQLTKSPVPDYSAAFDRNVELNGVTDYIQAPHDNNVNFGINDDFTVETWVKIPANQNYTLGSDNVILDKWEGNGVAPQYPFSLRLLNQTALLNSNKIVFVIQDGSQPTVIYSSMTLNDDIWHHIAIVKNNSTLSLYIDGVLDGTENVLTTGNTSNTAPVTIGRRKTDSHPDAFFTGHIDEVRIWNTARTQSEIQATMNAPLTGNEAGLVAYYDMNRDGQGAGLTVENKVVATGSALNGTTFGTVITPIFTQHSLVVNTVSIVDFKIFPNPATTQLTIKTPIGINISQVSIYDVNGRLVNTITYHGHQDVVVDVSILLPAMYIMHVIDDKGHRMYKSFVKD